MLQLVCDAEGRVRPAEPLPDGAEFRGTPDSWAIFNQNGEHRYLLYRSIRGGLFASADCHDRPALYCLCNPSTADHRVLDNTLIRCLKRADALGYNGMLVANVFAFRATDPADMRAATDPVGPLNDEAILAAAACAGVIICGWGTIGSDRGQDVERLLLEHGYTPHALAVCDGGEPTHPLYLPYSLKPEPLADLRRKNLIHT